MASADILVTGAGGFVGRSLTGALTGAGHRVRGISIQDGDIAHHDLPFPEVRHVFHLAARMFVPESWENPTAFYETNVLGTVNVLDFCRRRKASLTLVSSYVYGTPERLPIAEDHPLAAFNPYGHTKLMAEDAARFFERHFGIRLCIVRPFNLYGPEQDPRFLIPTLIRQVLDPGAPEISVADRHPKRDYLYIDDLAALLLATLQEDAAGTFNAGSGESHSIEEIVAILRRLTGCRKPLADRGERRPNEVMDVVADIGAAAARLGWRPRVPLEDGIARMVRAARP